MTNKILKAVHEKIVENFTFEFPPFILEDEFERDYTRYTEKLWLSLSSKINEYQNINNSEDINSYKELIKMTPLKFSTNYNSYNIYDRRVIRNRKGEFEICLDSNAKQSWRMMELDNDMKMELYNQIVESRLKQNNLLLIPVSDWLTSLEDYIQQRHTEIIQTKEFGNLSVLFKDVSFSSACKHFDNLDTVEMKFQEIVKDCKSRYVNSHGKYWTLLKTTEKYINMENILPFTYWVVNVGMRNWKYNHNTLVNLFSVINKNKEYSFEYKNDGKKIEDIYVNLFLLTDNTVTKVSVGSTKLIQKTPYLITKDIQRIDIIDGNIVELHMHKHFDPEAIVFDTDEEAYKFQTKVSEKRDLRRESRR